MNALLGPQHSMSRATFARFRALIYRLSGIALGESKEGLVRSRVSKRMRALGITDYDAYLERILSDADGEEIIHLLDVISTNVTSFFREENHFRVLSQAVRHWVSERRTRLRFWSAACSTGEEAYSMAMTVAESLDGHAADVKILATDLSTRALDRARAGVYGLDKMGGVSRELRVKYFQRESKGMASLSVRGSLRQAITFARLNLVEIPFPMSGPFDAVFCRNVMIYFDTEVRRRLLGELHRLLRPGGRLFVGHSESLTGLTAGFRSEAASVYVKT